MRTLLILALTASLHAATNYDVRTIALPGGSDRGIAMDYLAYDATTKSLWVPAGSGLHPQRRTGRVGYGRERS